MHSVSLTLVSLACTHTARTHTASLTHHSDRLSRLLTRSVAQGATHTLSAPPGYFGAAGQVSALARINKREQPTREG